MAFLMIVIVNGHWLSSSCLSSSCLDKEKLWQGNAAGSILWLWCFMAPGPCLPKLFDTLLHSLVETEKSTKSSIKVILRKLDSWCTFNSCTMHHVPKVYTVAHDSFARLSSTREGYYEVYSARCDDVVQCGIPKVRRAVDVLPKATAGFWGNCHITEMEPR